MSGALPPTIVAALARFRHALEARFGSRLREVVLFGSRARGEAHEDSDVDVFVVIDDVTFDERKAVIGTAYDVDAAGMEDDQEHGWVGLSPLVMSSAHAADMRARERLLLRDIDREGMRL